jgi:pimeloyl-ACP methyl ester carboxylesterase
MVGAQDSVTPPAEAQALVQGIPGAVLETIPGAGHLSNLENPKAFDAGLRAFLEENRARLT